MAVNLTMVAPLSIAPQSVAIAELFLSNCIPRARRCDRQLIRSGVAPNRAKIAELPRHVVHAPRDRKPGTLRSSNNPEFRLEAAAGRPLLLAFIRSAPAHSGQKILS